MIKVTSRPGEPGEKLLQRFKRICSKEGILRECKKRSYFEKPSEKKRRVRKEQIRALAKAARRAAKASLRRR